MREHQDEKALKTRARRGSLRTEPTSAKSPEARTQAASCQPPVNQPLADQPLDSQGLSAPLEHNWPDTTGTPDAQTETPGHQGDKTSRLGTSERQNTEAEDTKAKATRANGAGTGDDERLVMMRQKLSHPQAGAVRDRSLGAPASRTGISRGGAPLCALASAPDLSALAPGPDVSHLDAPHPATSGATPPV